MDSRLPLRFRPVPMFPSGFQVIQRSPRLTRPCWWPTPVLFELHADCLAGVYMGKTRDHAKERMSAFARSLFAMGDYNFTSPYHHGAPEQRVAAMESGYDLGASGLDVADAAKIAAQWAREL